MTAGKKFLKTPLQESAYRFAKECHKGQFRKGTPRPYINHCTEVARILNKFGYSEEIIVAGLLHDTVEDTEVTLEDLRIGFGERVSNLVKHVTETRTPGVSWTKRKVMYIKNLTDAPEGSVAVSAADKLHNVTEMLQDWLKVGDAVFLRFSEGKEKQKWFHRSLTEVYFVRGLFFENRSLLKMAQSINKVLGKMGM
jgi:(p)ppGpp synthase/HD superfamily hydrolase